jgi:hypothetical protein
MQIGSVPMVLSVAFPVKLSSARLKFDVVGVLNLTLDLAVAKGRSMGAFFLLL